MFIFYGGLFFALFLRILYIQATGQVEGEELKARAAALYQKEAVLTAERGKILDRNGNIIAEDTLSYRLIAVVNPAATTNKEKPQHVVDPEETAKVLAKYIAMDESEIYKILTKRRPDGRYYYQVEFGAAGRGISHEVKTKIENEKLPGIKFVSDTKRYYPNGVFASHLIGFTQREKKGDGTFISVGKMGLELTYNKQLTGQNGKIEYESDAYHYLIPNREKMVQPAKNGNNIYLTIDKTIQNFLEDAMTKVHKEYNPEAMVGIVADAKTGEILAMSQRPTFNPETREGLENNWLNYVIQEVIEPGSTMKTFTLAAAIESGHWNPNATYQSGAYKVLDRTIRDHNTYGWGRITYLEGFQRSSNTAMANLLEIMGNDTFMKYLNAFGFGQKTGIDLPGEVTGTILTRYPINYVTTSFGQGSTVTPIQLVQAMTAITNDGVMMQPYVIDKIVDSTTGKVIEEHKPKEKGKPISASTAKQVREILASTVTSEVGTARNYKIDGYEVAGKTGTAQIPNPNGKGYLYGKNNYLYSFLGMAPADNPRLIVYVAVKRPKLKDTEVGSEPVAKVFNPVMENSLKYLNIDPEDVKPVETVKIRNYIGKNAVNIQHELESQGLKPIVIGEGGEITDQYPKEGIALLKNNLVFLKTDGVVTLPSFENWSLRNLLIYKAMSGINIEIVGEGYVESQSVTENTVISDSSPVVVKLKTPEESFVQTSEETEEELPQD
ncbi:penicillin-binding protein [Ureibacillus thermophilus]|uniref:Penicillin-binding protein n=1 Tax=Ureibacillus thermophilus TaxID=367743 RepID=A0A4P6UQK0_9BACL|nr:penicillin-binding protein [Ureibacillus thermophilus]QBK25549.1 penicillin-binding protein [Ureibacillus thermophilus]